MSEQKQVTDKGWAFSVNSRKAHYYDKDARSLCGRYVRLGGAGGYEPETEMKSMDDCRGCRTKLDKRGVK